MFTVIELVKGLMTYPKRCRLGCLKRDPDILTINLCKLPGPILNIRPVLSVFNLHDQLTGSDMNKSDMFEDFKTCKKFARRE